MNALATLIIIGYVITGLGLIFAPLLWAVRAAMALAAVHFIGAVVSLAYARWGWAALNGVLVGFLWGLAWLLAYLHPE